MGDGGLTPATCDGRLELGAVTFAYRSVRAHARVRVCMRGRDCAIACARACMRACARVQRPATLVLLRVSLRVMPGEMLALIGHSGAGKSTLVRPTHAQNANTRVQRTQTQRARARTQCTHENARTQRARTQRTQARARARTHAHATHTHARARTRTQRTGAVARAVPRRVGGDGHARRHRLPLAQHALAARAARVR